MKEATALSTPSHRTHLQLLNKSIISTGMAKSVSKSPHARTNGAILFVLMMKLID
jgi:hypothetical protein